MCASMLEKTNKKIENEVEEQEWTISLTIFNALELDIMQDRYHELEGGDERHVEFVDYFNRNNNNSYPEQDERTLLEEFFFL